MGQPVFGFLAVTSGSHEGAIIHHMRLANALHRRGFKVVVYWMLERNPDLVDPGIAQRTVVHGLRYVSARPSMVWEGVGRLLGTLSLRDRRRFVQNYPRLGQTIFRNLVALMCGGGGDAAVIRRLDRLLAADGVTHLLPTFAMICPLVVALKERGRHRFDFLPTFQGEEIFAYQARLTGRLDDYYRQLRRCVDAAPWKTIALSEHYAARLCAEIGLDRDRLQTIFAGIEPPSPQQPRPSYDIVAAEFPRLRRDVPIVTYLGRQDVEKGIDLLIYAARMLSDRGVPYQLVVCGGSSFGKGYQEVCQQIAHHLAVAVSWKGHVSDALRAALYAHSRCIVYPPIHGEPFGMVAPEAMAYGTPVLVPDLGGITETIAVDGRAASASASGTRATSRRSSSAS
jgi:glycosyltransferase involved in cell wall biosynthesis